MSVFAERSSLLPASVDKVHSWEQKWRLFLWMFIHSKKFVFIICVVLLLSKVFLKWVFFFSGNIYLLPGQIHSTEVQQRHPVPVVGQCTGLVVHSVFHTLGSHLHDLQFERHSRHAMAGTHVRFQERLLQLILHLQLTTTCFSLCQRFSTLCTPAEELSLNGPEKKALELSDLTTCPDTMVS